MGVGFIPICILQPHLMAVHDWPLFMVNDHESPSVAPIEHQADRRSLIDTPLRRFFESAVQHQAADLLLRGGQVPRIRVRGSLKTLDHPKLDTALFEKWIEDSLSPAQWDCFTEHGSLDLGVDIEIADGRPHRFRVNVFRTRGRSAIAARCVSNVILSLQQLHMPPVLSRVAEELQGLVLVAGITGSGKSTTIASMLEHINRNRACHIVTLEDPIEYLFVESKAVINQREIGIDVPSFALGLRALVRENPDVVLIGEMRDRESFEVALQSAETGHLVFGTVHASSVSQVFARIYDLFPAAERTGIRNMLAYQLKAMVCQKMLMGIRDDARHVPAVEILLQCPPAQKMILDGREHQLDEVIQSQRESGMQTFTDSLADLVNRQYIHPKVALSAATRPEELRMKLRGIQVL